MNNLAYSHSIKNSSSGNKFLRERKFIDKLNHVDKMWNYLQEKHPDLLAVNDLRGKLNSRFSYLELANNIDLAS